MTTLLPRGEDSHYTEYFGRRAGFALLPQTQVPTSTMAGTQDSQAFFFSGPRATAKSQKTPPLGDFCLARDCAGEDTSHLSLLSVSPPGRCCRHEVPCIPTPCVRLGFHGVAASRRGEFGWAPSVSRGLGKFARQP